ncbi:uncharacterized protein LOC126298889 [Schistocerca gregaria]|uniref:uncharacterized protein LOC126298889 n=1 Tax=Schistocerca gregaria TaxID=7010 RepID=UPI00211E4F86|nr:uncharacterized protein LOC126298889 [Schistocerca gregaria]
MQAALRLTCMVVAAGALSAVALPPQLLSERRTYVDLCINGLGADSCVSLFEAAVPPNLTHRATDKQSGVRPRNTVCPTLCQNGLGYPLCRCRQQIPRPAANWTAVCDAFCSLQNVTVYGCSECKKQDTMLRTMAKSVVTFEAAETEEDWDALCHVLCKQGDGGLACSCDIIP